MKITGTNGEMRLLPYHVEWLKKYGITLGMLCILEALYPNCEPTSFMLESKEWKIMKDRLQVDDNGITDGGKLIMEALSVLQPEDAKKKGKVKTAIVLSDEMENHWKTFYKYWPVNTEFTWKGRTFSSNRGNMRGGTEAQCKEKWVKVVVKDKEVAPERLLHAAKAMFTNKMDECYVKGKNELNWIAGMIPWLNQHGWVGWENVKIKEDKVEHKNQEMLSI
jgi:hypothetical protein